MFEWMNRHKKDIMKYTLWLVIPSFVVLYGYGECAKPRRVEWVANVNGNAISEYEWSQWIENIQNRMQQYGQDVKREDLRGEALDTTITLALNRQKADALGVQTLDSEVSQTIQEMPYFKDQAGNFSVIAYQNLLRQIGKSPVQFEEEQRDVLTRSKLRTLVASSLFVADNESKRTKEREDQKIHIDYLAFEPSRYVNDVTPTPDGLQKFFDENREDYRIADQRRISYARFFPANYIENATFTDFHLNRFFEDNRESYKIPDSVMVEYLTYVAQNFVDQAQASEEEIQKYYDEHKATFNHPPQVQIRYIAQSMTDLLAKQEATEEEIKDFYDKNTQRFTHDEQAKARHILLKVTEGLSAEEEDAVRTRLLEIRKEIEGGLAFEEAAKKYSESPGSEKGGDLGYFSRGQMVPPFEKAAFELPLGQISEPVKTQFGYHLIKVEDRKEKGTDTLEQVREDIAKTLKERKALTAFREEMEKLTSLDAVAGQYEIKTTDWFARGASIPGFTPGESSMLSSAAFRNDPNKTVSVVGYPNMENVYAIERLGFEESTPKTLEEAHAEVLEKVKQAKAEEIARAAAQADADKIRSASLTLDTIGTERGLKIETSDFFTRQDQFVRGFGSRPAELINAAFTLKDGEITGPVKTQLGYHIIRLSAREPEHIPELAEVRQQVEQDCLQNQAEEAARLAGRKFSDDLFDNQIALEVGAASDQVESGTTGLFTLQDPIPGIGQQSSLNYAVFEIEKVGDISEPVPVSERSQSMNPNEKQPVEAFYVMQLQEIKPTYLPELAEVKDKVEKDYRLVLAADLTRQHASDALNEIKQAIASGQPVEATKAVELKSFEDTESKKTVAKGGVYRGPYEITGNGSVSGVMGRAWSLTKTAIALQPGQVSDLVTCYREKRMKDGTVVQGPMVGMYILQVLGKKSVGATEPATPNTMQDQLTRRLQSVAYEAWIDEVSSTAKILYNDKILAPEEDEEGVVAAVNAGNAEVKSAT